MAARTSLLPAGERFSSWLELVSQTVVPVEVDSDAAADSKATIRTVELGEVTVMSLAIPPARARRTSKLIRRSDPELFQLGLNVQGPAQTSQHGRTVALNSSDMVLFDSSHPFHNVSGNHGRSGTDMMVLFPRRLLPLPESKVGKLLVTALPGHDGMGALVASHVRGLIKHSGQCRPVDAARLSAVTVDLIAAMLAHHLDEDRVLPEDTSRRALLVRVHAFIDQHLSDPELSPQTIAAAHHISLRSLHRLFQTQDSTIAGWIRDRRLERCRCDLSDPMLADRPINAIAARWGFTNAAHFTRAFQAAYGLRPNDYRRQQQVAQVTHIWRA
ncbi:AraC-like ligand-binding domain-containing protein [Actinomadura rudentiformis]|nr:helix-turn-helix domain-containing protein [Actinomadura rudentiformis]